MSANDTTGPREDEGGMVGRDGRGLGGREGGKEDLLLLGRC